MTLVEAMLTTEGVTERVTAIISRLIWLSKRVSSGLSAWALAASMHAALTTARNRARDMTPSSLSTQEYTQPGAPGYTRKCRVLEWRNSRKGPGSHAEEGLTRSREACSREACPLDPSH